MAQPSPNCGIARIGGLNHSHLEGQGNQLLRTGNLKFDLLGAIDRGGGYDDLLPDSEVLDVGGYPVRVLRLEKLTETKRLQASLSGTKPARVVPFEQIDGGVLERSRAKKIAVAVSVPWR